MARKSKKKPSEIVQVFFELVDGDELGQHLLGVMRPIRNAPECSNASCHVHQANVRVLGVIDADLSLAGVDTQMAQQKAKLLYFLFGDGGIGG